MDAIAEQSEGLTTFFESYRVLSRIPDPVRKEFQVCSLLEKLEILVSSSEENAGIQLSFRCENPAITVSAIHHDAQVIIEVIDNGHGIPAEIADEIFMPFFTTRQKGTGVGLSYSRQVMNINGGRIEYNSVPGHTVFRLVF